MSWCHWDSWIQQNHLVELTIRNRIALSINFIAFDLHFCGAHICILHIFLRFSLFPIYSTVLHIFSYFIFKASLKQKKRNSFAIHVCYKRLHPEQNVKKLNFQLKSIWDIKWLGNETEMIIHIVEKNWFSSTFKSFVTFHNYLFPCLIDEMIKKVSEIEKTGINLNPVLKYTNEKRFECIICPRSIPM